GIGEQIWDVTPSCFREAYKVLRREHGRSFAIQLVSDDPYVPWELMWPSDVEDARPLAVDHAVARWLLDYATTMPQRLPRGTIVTIAPRYEQLPSLPGAQEEARLFVEEFGARSLEPATRDALLRLLTTSTEDPVAILHFAGHGTFSLEQPETST